MFSRVCGPYSIFMAYLSEVFMDKYRNFAVSTAGIFSAIGNFMQPGELSKIIFVNLVDISMVNCK